MYLSQDIFDYIIVPFLRFDHLYHCRYLTPTTFKKYMIDRRDPENRLWIAAIFNKRHLVPNNHYPVLIHDAMLDILLECIRYKSWDTYCKLIREISNEIICHPKHCDVIEKHYIPFIAQDAIKSSLDNNKDGLFLPTRMISRIFEPRLKDYHLTRLEKMVINVGITKYHWNIARLIQNCHPDYVCLLHRFLVEQGHGQH